MANSKHTPGPWHAVNIGSDEEPMMQVMASRIAGQPPRHCVAIAATGDSPQWMEGANARLIAAAPEMLEALEKWASKYRGWSELELRKRVGEADFSLIMRTFAVINRAKAEGGK